MRMRVAVVYNKPQPSRYDATGEQQSVLGVLEAVKAVHQALVELEFDVTLVPLVPPLEQVEKDLRNLKRDLVFNLFEGFCGEPETEAIVPDILSRIGIPFTGSPGPALKLAVDKAKTKAILQDAGIKTPKFQVLNPETVHTFQLDYPCIVKPCCEDASNGLSAGSVVHDFPALERQVGFVSDAYGGNAIVEKFIPGREFNATVLGNSEFTVLPVSEIVYSLPSGIPEILTFAAKWEPDSPYYEGTKPVCPAEIEDEEHRHIVETTTTVYRLLGCQGYARADLRLDHEGELNVVEVNPNPDISPEAGAARQAAAAGMTYTQFIAKLVQLGLDAKDDENRHPAYVSRRQARRGRDTRQYA
jgi:D-alanine-D-alanine ligase